MFGIDYNLANCFKLHMSITDLSAGGSKTESFMALMTV